MIRSAIAAAGIALVLGSALSAQQGRDETTFTWSRQMASGSRVTIRNGDGPITVRESPDSHVEVRATKVLRGRASARDVAFDVVESGGDVEICTVYDDQRDCRDRDRGNNRYSSRGSRIRVEYTLLVPRTMRVNVTTGSGDLSVDRAGSDVNATTGNGKIMIGQTLGRVDATSGNGDVTIENANGPVHVTTGNGRIMVNTAQGPVSATTGNGDVDVRMKALTADGDMTFTSGSGAIRLSLPDGFNGRIDASTGNGSLRSDFEISVLGRLDPQHMRGTIGKGGPLVRLNTGNGTIELRKN